MEPGGSMPQSKGISNNPYPESNQPNSSKLNPWSKILQEKVHHIKQNQKLLNKLKSKVSEKIYFL